MVYSFPGSNPVVFSDPLGLFGPGALAAAGGGCIAVDGPFPFGDLVGIPLILGAGAWALGDAIQDYWGNDKTCPDCPTAEVPPFPRVVPLPPPIIIKEDADCRKIRADCRKKCADETLPTGALSGDPFFRCYRECRDRHGC